MKKKVILIISLLSIFLMGCSDKKIESKLVEEVAVKIAKEN